MFIRLLLVLALTLIFPTSVYAYSYGDPNKEELAETYKVIAAHLEQSPPDWSGASAAFASVKKEMADHFGSSVAQTLQANFTAKQKDLVLHNYKAVLVLNIDRRLDYAEKEFSNYSQAKLLLAKGRGTFDVLSPFVSAGISDKVYAAFDKALEALGNPGLFGVGAVPADKDEFLKQANIIRTSLSGTYKLKTVATKPASSGNTTQPKPQPGKTAKGSTNNATQQTKPKGNQSTGSSQSGSNTKSPEQTTPSTGNTVPAKSDQPANTQPSPDDATKNSGEAADQPVDSVNTQDEKADSPDIETAANPEDNQVEHASDHNAGNEVNPYVTVTVFGGLILIASGAFWIAKRKGWL